MVGENVAADKSCPLDWFFLPGCDSASLNAIHVASEILERIQGEAIDPAVRVQLRCLEVKLAGAAVIAANENAQHSLRMAKMCEAMVRFGQPPQRGRQSTWVAVVALLILANLAASLAVLSRVQDVRPAHLSSPAQP